MDQPRDFQKQTTAQYRSTIEVSTVPMSTNILNNQIDKVYGKASGRLKLLKRIQFYIPSIVAQTIYTLMIEPFAMYCSPIYANLHDTGCNKLQKIQDGGRKVIGKKYKNPANLNTLCNRKVAIQVSKFTKSAKWTGFQIDSNIFHTT